MPDIGVCAATTYASAMVSVSLKIGPLRNSRISVTVVDNGVRNEIILGEGPTADRIALIRFGSIVGEPYMFVGPHKLSQTERDIFEAAVSIPVRFERNP